MKSIPNSWRPALVLATALVVSSPALADAPKPAAAPAKDAPAEAAAPAPDAAPAPATTPEPVPPAAAGDVDVIDRIVATLGDEAITLREVKVRAAAARNPVVEAMGGSRSASDGGLKTALEDLIAERLILAEARKMEIEATDADVDRHIKTVEEQNNWKDADLGVAVQMLGFADIGAFRDYIRKELVKSQVVRMKVASRVRITDREVEEEFLRQYEGGKSEEQVHVRDIEFPVGEDVTIGQVRDAVTTAEKVRANLSANPTRFEEISRQVGATIPNARGGDVGWFSRGQLQAALEDAAFALKDGEVSSVLQSGQSFHVLQVIERRRVPIKDVEEARARVRFELSETAFRKMYQAYVQELRASSRVDIRGL